MKGKKMQFEGWDYSQKPKEFCECKKPDFDKAGICRNCERPLKGITLDVQSASVVVKPILKLGEKRNG